MSLSVLALEIEDWFTAHDAVYTVLDQITDQGAAFLYELPDEIRGFISLEDNAEDLAVPTVSIAVWVADLDGADTHDLLNLLALSGSFLGAALTAVVSEEGDADLFVQRRIPVDGFELDSLEDHLEELLHQVGAVFSPQMTSEDEAGSAPVDPTETDAI